MGFKIPALFQLLCVYFRATIFSARQPSLATFRLRRRESSYFRHLNKESSNGKSVRRFQASCCFQSRCFPHREERYF